MDNITAQKRYHYLSSYTSSWAHEQHEDHEIIIIPPSVCRVLPMNAKVFLQTAVPVLT